MSCWPLTELRGHFSSLNLSQSYPQNGNCAMRVHKGTRGLYFISLPRGCLPSAHWLSCSLHPYPHYTWVWNLKKFCQNPLISIILWHCSAEQENMQNIRKWPRAGSSVSFNFKHRKCLKLFGHTNTMHMLIEGEKEAVSEAMLVQVGDAGTNTLWYF